MLPLSCARFGSQHRNGPVLRISQMVSAAASSELESVGEAGAGDWSRMTQLERSALQTVRREA